MIFYSPLDGEAYTASIASKPRHCFLMTRLGKPVPKEVSQIEEKVHLVCRETGYTVINANSKVTGRDFLLKIWKLIAAAPLAVGICHESIPAETQSNIWYELGVAQAMGKETVIIKSPDYKLPSDFVRTEYVRFDQDFDKRFRAFLDSLDEQAEHYELVARQLDRNPILAIDYLKRAFLITGNLDLREKALSIRKRAGLRSRAKNSVEVLAAEF